MLVFYSGWGYWEESDEERQEVGRISRFIKVCGLFELPKNKEMELKYTGETIADHLSASIHSDIKEPESVHGGDNIYFVLCDEPFDTPPDPHLQANNITKKYTTTDIVPDIIDSVADTPKKLTETERNTMLKLIIGMAIDAYGYKPEESRNSLTGEKNGLSAKLQKHNISINDDTIRKYLTEAKNLL